MIGPTDREVARGGWAELLQNRRFLLLQASGAFAGAGYAVYSVTVLFIEYAVYTGTFLVAPFVDRARDKRTLLLLWYPIQAVAAASLAVGIESGSLPLVALLAI